MIRNDVDQGIHDLLADLQQHKISHSKAEACIHDEVSKLEAHYKYEIAVLLWHLKLDDKLYAKYAAVLQAIENGAWGDAGISETTICKCCNTPLLSHDLHELKKCFVESVAKYKQTEG